MIRMLGAVEGAQKPAAADGSSPAAAACPPQGHRAHRGVLRHHPVGRQRGVPLFEHSLHTNVERSVADGVCCCGRRSVQPYAN